MQHYKLRIDTHEHEKLLKGITQYIISYENTPEMTNPHTHFYIKTDLKRRTLISRVKALISYRPGNGFYSLRELEPDDDGYLKYQAYLLKQKNFTFVGFSDAEKEQIHQYNEKVQEQMKERKQKKLPVWKKIMSTINPANVDYDLILSSVISYHRENEILVRVFQIISYTDTIYLKMCPEDATDYLKNLVYKKCHDK